MSESRLKKCFETLRAQKRTALIPFITAGDPGPKVTVPMMHAMVKAGADVIELGVPFSDPMADGPVIQKASERALKFHTSLRDVIGMVKQFREQNKNTPVVLMGYLNPVEIMGYETFAKEASSAGVDGVLTVDLPPEEAAGVIDIFKNKGLDPVFLIAPTTTEKRIRKICDVASGFVYYVSLKGVTGAANLDVQGVSDKLKQIRGFTQLPVGVGFGIQDAETAAAVGSVSDAVVVGSALVKKFAEFENNPAQIEKSVTELLSSMRVALDSKMAKTATK